LIATIRRILVVTLETSDQTPASQVRIGAAPRFERAMIELGTLAILTLVISITIYLSRRPGPGSASEARRIVRSCPPCSTE